jgi:ribosomal protein S18 acetylase RimI-like enzyme
MPASSAPPAVRVAVRDDAARLAALDRRSWSPLHDVHPRPAPPDKPFFDETHLPGQYLVAELAEPTVPGVVGFIRVVQPFALETTAHVREIQGLLVDERARRRGVALALLEAACERAREEGARHIRLHVLGHNTPARRMYEASGFSVEGVLREQFLLDGRYVDDVLMGRRLTP